MLEMQHQQQKPQWQAAAQANNNKNCATINLWARDGNGKTGRNTAALPMMTASLQETKTQSHQPLSTSTALQATLSYHWLQLLSCSERQWQSYLWATINCQQQKQHNQLTIKVGFNMAVLWCQHQHYLACWHSHQVI